MPSEGFQQTVNNQRLIVKKAIHPDLIRFSCKGKIPPRRELDYIRERLYANSIFPFHTRNFCQLKLIPPRTEPITTRRHQQAFATPGRSRTAKPLSSISKQLSMPLMGTPETTKRPVNPQDGWSGSAAHRNFSKQLFTSHWDFFAFFDVKKRVFARKALFSQQKTFPDSRAHRSNPSCRLCSWRVE